MSYQPPQPSYYVQIQKPPSNGRAIASMILGIIAIVFGVWAWVPLLGIFNALVGGVCGILGAVLGHSGLAESGPLNGAGRGQATTGLILSYITLGIVIIVTVFWIVMFVLSSLRSS